MSRCRIREPGIVEVAESSPDRPLWETCLSRELAHGSLAGSCPEFEVDERRCPWEFNKTVADLCREIAQDTATHRLAPTTAPSCLLHGTASPSSSRSTATDSA